MIPVKHPDTIPGLSPDCRRVLREDYMAIQVCCDRRNLTIAESDRAAKIRAAVAEYRRTAALWGVDVA